jgi:hypothetical protein
VPAGDFVLNLRFKNINALIITKVAVCLPYSLLTPNQKLKLYLGENCSPPLYYTGLQTGPFPTAENSNMQCFLAHLDRRDKV